VTVAGAGAVGTTVALSLARAGAKVRLIDPGGENASAVAAGMLAPAFEALFDEAARPHLAMMRRARDLWPQLAQSIGLPIERHGALALGAADEVDEWRDMLQALGVSARRREGAVPGLWTDEDWRLEPCLALEALRRAAIDAGVEIACGVVTAATIPSGEALVIATGASKSLVAIAPELAHLTPIKGHILQAPGIALDGPVVRFAGGYVCPASGGPLIGASMEAGRDDSKVDPAIVESLRARAARFVPALDGAQVQASTGVRAASPDGLPLVGASARPGVWLAVGARRNGWLLAPLMAQALVAAMAGAAPAWARAFDPSRLSRP
jgi:glycine oxidase